MTAYAQASLLLSVEQPACRMGWTTLARLGRIESEHGTLGGNHLRAARYLCASGADLTTGKGWQRAIHSYNHSDVYTARVLDMANQYALASGMG